MMKKNAFTLLQAVLMLISVAMLAVLFYPVLANWGKSERDPYPVCHKNLKQIALGIKQYIQDYDEKYPLVNSGKQGWVDIITPYLKSPQVFQCPEETSGGTEGTTDYFYNARLSGVTEASLTHITNTIMNGDGIGDAPANFSLTQMPKVWKNDPNSPAWRHLQGARYSFADGHIKWMKASKLTNAKVTAMNASFAPN